MPWKEIRPMDQKVQMIGDWVSKEYRISELSELYGVSRKTVYKWVARYQRYGEAGLREMTRAPRGSPNATRLEVVNEMLWVKKGHMKWGPKKVVAWLRYRYPEKRWPADSTASAILKRNGLVKDRRHRRRTPPYTEPFLGCDYPNSVWSADFKGQFRLGDGQLCYPVTITDNYSRYLLRCWGLRRPTFDETRLQFEVAFRHYGLPEAIRTDNGSPFGSVAVGGLTRLSAWFIRLGIRPERIEPGHPEQNGRHERMHRTLKEYAISPPRKTQAEQQRAFVRFLREYNDERPNEAVGQKPPGSIYRSSIRPYPVRLPKVEYDSDVVVRQVNTKGYIKWQGGLLYVCEALAQEPVGLVQIDNDYWEVHYSFHRLGTLDSRSKRILPH